MYYMVISYKGRTPIMICSVEHIIMKYLKWKTFPNSNILTFEVHISIRILLIVGVAGQSVKLIRTSIHGK